MRNFCFDTVCNITLKKDKPQEPQRFNCGSWFIGKSGVVKNKKNAVKSYKYHWEISFRPVSNSFLLYWLVLLTCIFLWRKCLVLPILIIGRSVKTVRLQRIHFHSQSCYLFIFQYFNPAGSHWVRLRQTIDRLDSFLHICDAVHAGLFSKPKLLQAILASRILYTCSIYQNVTKRPVLYLHLKLGETIDFICLICLVLLSHMHVCSLIIYLFLCLFHQLLYSIILTYLLFSCVLYSLSIYSVDFTLQQTQNMI